MPKLTSWVLLGALDHAERTPHHRKPDHEDWCECRACCAYWSGFYASVNDHEAQIVGREPLTAPQTAERDHT